MLDKNTTAMGMMDQDPEFMRQVNRGGDDVPPPQQEDHWLELAASALDVMSLVNPAGALAMKFLNPEERRKGIFGWLYNAWKDSGGQKPSQMEGDIYNTHQEELAVFDAKTFDYFNKLYINNEIIGNANDDYGIIIRF